MEPDDRKPEQGGGNVFAARNDVVRVDAVDSLDEHLSSSLRTFFRVLGVWGAKLCSERGIIQICRRNRVLTPHRDDAEKPRG